MGFLRRLAGSRRGPLGVVRLLSRPGCHLCEELRAVAEPIVIEAGGTLVEVDVDSDPELAVRFGSEIPVLLTADGKLLAKAKDGAAAIRRRLG